jgi:hypothetical protein
VQQNALLEMMIQQTKSPGKTGAASCAKRSVIGCEHAGTTREAYVTGKDREIAGRRVGSRRNRQMGRAVKGQVMGRAWARGVQKAKQKTEVEEASR